MNDNFWIAMAILSGVPLLLVLLVIVPKLLAFGYFMGKYRAQEAIKELERGKARRSEGEAEVSVRRPSASARQQGEGGGPRDSEAT